MNEIQRTHVALLNRYNQQGWWPILGEYHPGMYNTSTEHAFEIILGTILTQNTSWKNAEKALEELRKKERLNPNKLAEAKKEEIQTSIRSSGYYQQKTDSIQHIARIIVNEGIKKFLRKTRKELLEIKGIGKETADSILLYAANKPQPVIDAYTRRILSRIGIIKETEAYDKIAAIFKGNHEFLNETHALLVKHAKEYCQKKPKCAQCPILHQCNYGKHHAKYN